MTQRIGERLREAREAGRYSVEDIGKATRLPLRFIEALERSDFRALGGQIYMEDYGKVYAEFLGIFDNVTKESLTREWETYALRDRLRFTRTSRFRRIISRISGPRYTLMIPLGIIGIVIATYFGSQILSLLSAPELTITFPERELTFIHESSIVYSGIVREDAELSINHRPVALKSRGQFEERLYLAKGLNRIDVEIVNVSGKSSRDTRYVMYVPQS